MFDSVSSKLGFGKNKSVTTDALPTTEPDSEQALVVATSTEVPKKPTFKPAPPVTTPPPPKREYVPHPVARPINRPKTQMFSQSRSISSKQLMKPPPARRASVQSPLNTETSSLPMITYSDDPESRPVLPPRPSPTATVSAPDATALVLYEERPTLPPRRVSVPLPASSTPSNALVQVESAPSLPPRNYTLPNPPLPERTYRQASLPASKPMPEAKIPPKKPQHLVSRSFTIPTVPNNQKPPITRVTSGSSTISTDSVMSTPSLVSTVSSIAASPILTPKLTPKLPVLVKTTSLPDQTTPTTESKSPNIAELIKSLEAKKAVPSAVAGSVRVPGIA